MGLSPKCMHYQSNGPGPKQEVAIILCNSCSYRLITITPGPPRKLLLYLPPCGGLCSSSYQEDYHSWSKGLLKKSLYRLFSLLPMACVLDRFVATASTILHPWTQRLYARFPVLA